MKIVVTGGSGQFGRHVVREFASIGHHVISVDRIPHPEHRPSFVCALDRSGDLFETAAGADALVHLAGIPRPDLAPESVTFNNNVAAVYNVCKVATVLGIPRVVIASSIGAYGFLYAQRMQDPDYLPLDEAHPCRPTDPYGLSKKIGEAVADSFAAQNPGSSFVSLRFPGINFDPTFALLRARQVDPRYRLPGFWTYIDVRDAVEACRLAIAVAPSGHTILNAAAPTSNMREPTDELMARFLPGVRKRGAALFGNWSGLDSTKAEQILGFRTHWVWESVA